MGSSKLGAQFWFHVVLLLCLLVQAGAVDLGKCRATFANSTGQTQITYKECVQTCGGGAGSLSWTMFSMGFSTWLLPWIALIFQLPFGATDRVDNLVSALLAIGSPALAGYSLAITRLNSRWLSRQFQHLRSPNMLNIPISISALQNIPFTVDTSGPLLQSLVVLKKNDEYWKSLFEAARRTRQWSIPAAMNILWVLVAFLFTIVGSLVDFGTFLLVPGDAGFSIAAVWTYLLPVVVGWLLVGSQPEPNYLREALKAAHKHAHVDTPSGPILASQYTPAISEPSTKLIDHVTADEKKTAPIFNYARVFIWSQNAECVLQLYEHAGTEDGGGAPVQRGMPQAYHYLPLPSLAQNPHPPARSSTSLFTKYDEEEPLKPVFATEVLHRVAFATALALGLQWGTTGAAVLIHIFTPPKGVGCRALTFSVYGAAGTVSFCLLLFSSILAHLVRLQTVDEKRSGLKQLFGYMVSVMRWLGKTIAILNGIAIVVACALQFGGIYDSCFCSSTIFGGNPDGVVRFVDDNIKGSEVYGYWIGGTVMALGISGLYSFAIYLAGALTG